MTTKEILAAANAEGEINSKNDPAQGTDVPIQTTFYTVFSHPDPQDDPTTPFMSAADPIVIEITSTVDGVLTLTWSGGHEPFMLQRKTTMDDLTCHFFGVKHLHAHQRSGRTLSCG